MIRPIARRHIAQKPARFLLNMMLSADAGERAPNGRHIVRSV